MNSQSFWNYLPIIINNNNYNNNILPKIKHKYVT